MFRLFITFLVYVHSLDDAPDDYFLSIVFPRKKSGSQITQKPSKIRNKKWLPSIQSPLEVTETS